MDYSSICQLAGREGERYKGISVRLRFIQQTQRRTRRGRRQEGADDTYLGCLVPVISCDLHPCAALYALILCMGGAGLTKEADCALCAPGKYQTGVGLVAEANCTWCVAGKYQSGSGLKSPLNAIFWLYQLMHTLVAWMHMRGNIQAL